VCVYTHTYFHSQPTRGGSPAWGSGDRLTTPRRKNSLLRVVIQGLVRVWALVNTVMNIRVP